MLPAGFVDFPRGSWKRRIDVESIVAALLLLTARPAGQPADAEAAKQEAKERKKERKEDRRELKRERRRRQ